MLMKPAKLNNSDPYTLLPHFDFLAGKLSRAIPDQVLPTNRSTVPVIPRIVSAKS